jgi:hypothetical protein
MFRLYKLFGVFLISKWQTPYFFLKVFFISTNMCDLVDTNSIAGALGEGFMFFFPTYILCSIVILSKFFYYSPPDAQVNFLKNNFKFTLKLTIKQLRHVSVQSVTPSSGSVLLVLAKFTVVKIANQNISVCGDVAAYIGGSLLVCLRCIVRE